MNGSPPLADASRRRAAATSRRMPIDPFNPSDAVCWTARGRTPTQAATLAGVWTRFPDLPAEAPLAARLDRTRARAEALKPFHEAIRMEAERERVTANFAFIERQIAHGRNDPRYASILVARDRHGFGWDDANGYADGHYAARAGWDYRPSGIGAERSSRVRAYELGFRDGGGQPEDLFDTARRALLAPREGSCAPKAPSRARSARPRPREWAAPTDSPRPARWPQRLVIVGRSCPRQLFTDLEASRAFAASLVIEANPAHGFRRLSGDGSTDFGALGDVIAARTFEDILLIADDHDLAFIEDHYGAIPLCPVMGADPQLPLQQRAQLRLWLTRGLDPGEVRAGGHIVWGKVVQGLWGRLGEFTARYAGPHQPRGHRIIVELAPGVLATGFRMPCGRLLAPERIISNRSHLRREMTNLLRDFAAALRHL